MNSNKGTSILGWVFAIAVAISTNPTLLAFLPESIGSVAHGVAGIIVAVAGGAFASSVKNKNVTGGKIAATKEAEARVEITLD